MAYDDIYEAYEENKKTKYDLIPNGTYDCKLSAEERKSTWNDELYLNLAFQIRKGLNQQAEGRIVWATIKHDKNKPEDYNHKQISYILGAIPERATFSGNDELIQFINGRNFLVEIYTEQPNEFHPDSVKNRIKFFSLKPSKTPDADESGSSQPVEEKKNLENVEISEEDLPF